MTVSPPIEDLPLALCSQSIFGGNTFLLEATGTEDPEKLLSILSEPLENNLVIFLPADSKAWVDNPKWAAFAAKATVIEEVKIGKTNLKKVLPSLLAQIDFFDFSKLTNMPELQQAVGGFVETKKDINIFDILQHIEAISLICCDRLSNSFDFRLYRTYFNRAQDTKFYPGHLALYNFLVSPNRSNKATLLLYCIEQTPNGFLDGRKFVGVLYRILKDLILCNTFLNPNMSLLEWGDYKVRHMTKFSSLSTTSIFRFQTMLMQYEPQFYIIRPVVALATILERLG